MSTEQYEDWLGHIRTQKLLTDYKKKHAQQLVRLKGAARISQDADVRQAAAELAATEVFLGELRSGDVMVGDKEGGNQ